MMWSPILPQRYALVGWRRTAAEWRGGGEYSLQAIEWRERIAVCGGGDDAPPSPLTVTMRLSYPVSGRAEVGV